MLYGLPGTNGLFKPLRHLASTAPTVSRRIAITCFRLCCLLALYCHCHVFQLDSEVFDSAAEIRDHGISLFRPLSIHPSNGDRLIVSVFRHCAEAEPNCAAGAGGDEHRRFDNIWELVFGNAPAIVKNNVYCSRIHSNSIYIHGIVRLFINNRES